jgi:hypothetical protein
VQTCGGAVFIWVINHELFPSYGPTIHSGNHDVAAGDVNVQLFIHGCTV